MIKNSILMYFRTHLRQFLGHKKIKYLDIAVCSKTMRMHPFINEFLVIFQIMTHLRPFLGRKNIKWILQSAQKWNWNAFLLTIFFSNYIIMSQAISRYILNVFCSLLKTELDTYLTLSCGFWDFFSFKFSCLVANSEKWIYFSNKSSDKKWIGIFFIKIPTVSNCNVECLWRLV